MTSNDPMDGLSSDEKKAMADMATADVLPPGIRVDEPMKLTDSPVYPPPGGGWRQD